MVHLLELGLEEGMRLISPRTPARKSEREACGHGYVDHVLGPFVHHLHACSYSPPSYHLTRNSSCPDPVRALMMVSRKVTVLVQ